MHLLRRNLFLMVAALLGGCLAAPQQDALRTELAKEWQAVPSMDDVRASWTGEQLHTEQGLMISCKTPGSQERTLTQNGVNDGVSYRQCPPLIPTGPSATQPWPAPPMGARLDPRS